MENKKKYLYGFLVALLIMGFGLFGASNAGLFKGALVLTSPSINTSIKVTQPKTLVKQLSLCGEDYNPVDKRLFSESAYNGFELTYSGKWHLCKLDVKQQPLEEQTCPNGWFRSGIKGPYTYSCSKSSTQAEFSLNGLSCGTNYNISQEGVSPISHFPGSYYHMIYCTKKGERPVDAPCPLGYENRRYLGLEKGESYIYLCGKR